MEMPKSPDANFSRGGTDIESLLVVAGFPRTGTTSIYKNLESHPGFSVPLRKELNFFSKAVLPALPSYFENFRRRKPGQVCVDISPMYSLVPDVPARLHAALPDARVVILVREPCRWIHSVYVQTSSHNIGYTSFPEFLRRGLFPAVKKSESLLLPLRTGVYQPALSAYARLFGDRLLVIDFAAFERDPLEVLRAIETFVGASPHFGPDAVDTAAHNSSALAQRYHSIIRNLLSQEWLVRLATFLLPVPLLRRVRGFFYYSRGTQKSRPAPTSEQELAAATMAADTEIYRRIFSDSAFRSGSEILAAGL